MTEQNEIAGRGDWIRTNDPLHPMQVRYRAAPRPEVYVPTLALSAPCASRLCHAPIGEAGL